MTTRLRIARLDSASYWTDVKEMENEKCTKVTTLKTKGDEIEINIWKGKTLDIVEREVPEDAFA